MLSPIPAQAAAGDFDAAVEEKFAGMLALLQEGVDFRLAQECASCHKSHNIGLKMVMIGIPPGPGAVRAAVPDPQRATGRVPRARGEEWVNDLQQFLLFFILGRIEFDSDVVVLNRSSTS